MNKRMTRVLSLVLTLVMFLSVATPGFAWGPGDIGSGWDHDIGDDDVRDPGFGPVEEVEEYDYFQALDEENNVQVTIEAPMGALPSLAEVRLEPVPAEDLMDAVEGLVDEDHQILLAMDISFWLGEDEIEPEEPVRVKISSPGLEGRSDLTVVHFPDDEDEPETLELIPEEDLTFALGTNEICFESADFSVYAVIGGSANDLKLTVEFYESATATTPLSTQVLVLEQFDEEGEKPLIDPGVPSMGDTQSFEGWRIDADHENLDVDGLNKYIHDNYASMTADATLRVYAMIFDVRYVVYHDQAGAVLKTQSFHVESGSTTSVTISHPYVAFQGGQNFTAWTPGDYVDVMGDYPLYKDGVEDHLYRNDTAYNLSDTLQLYPYVQTGDWLIFDNNLDQDSDNTSASYTSPVFVPAGETTVAPATPTRTGYDFGGWFKEEAMTNRFIFGSTLGQETTVYAKWIPKTTTYQVVFWQQNSTDAVGAEDSEKTYSFYKSDERTATTGQSVSLDLADSGTTADNRLGGNSASSIGEMGFYFEYNEPNSTPTSAVVKGDGSTVLNVYYDRKVITFEFVGQLASYSYSSSTYNSNYVYYGYDSSSGSVFKVTRSGSYWYDSSNTRYNGTVYHLTFDSDTLSNNSANLTYGSIQGLYGSTMDSFDWSSADSTISGNKWPYSGKYLMWHDETTGRYQNKQYQYTTGEATTATTVRYYLNEYAVSTTTRPYTCLGQDTSGNFTITLDDESLKSTETVYFAGDEYFGYELDRYNRTTDNYNNATVWDGGQVTCSYSQIGSGGHAYFYYARNKWTFAYESNGTQVKTESIYWQGSLTDLASYVPTNGPEGCYFDGWYADPGFGTPFDFSQEMPNHAVVVYAKWTVTRYRVVLDPTGGEAGVDASIVTFPGNQATTFRVDYGEKVEGSSINNAERAGYTLLGWYLDPEFTEPFNFANPVTDEIADMTYINASDADRQGIDPWNLDDNGQPITYTDVGRDNVRGKVTIYAHWRKDPNGIIGINIRYDAVESSDHEGYFGNDQTATIWDDPDIYADQAQAYAQPASTPKEYDPELKFLYWDILDKNGQSTGRKALPGMTFQVEFDDAKEEAISGTDAALEPEYFTFDRGNLNIIRPGQAGLMAETMTVYAPVDTIETGVDYLIGVKASDGTTYLLMSYNPSTGTYYGSASMSGYTTDHLSYAIPAVVDENGYVTGVDTSNISGATLAHVEWIFNSTSNGKYSIQSGYNSNYYLRVGDDGSTTNLNLYPASYSSGYGATWVWDSSTHRLSHYYSSSYYQLYLSMLSVGGVPTYFDVDNDTDYARTVQLYKKTTIEVGPTTYTVTFMDGYTNTKIADVTVEEGNAAVAPEAPDHSAQGMIFNGWDTAFDNVTADITVTAQYVSQSSLSYTVTFRYMQSNGEWTSLSQTVQHGDPATPPTLPTPPAGYTFNSWDRRYDSITSNITINAVYKQVATTKYVVTLRAVYGRADAGSVTHINWYSNIYDAYGNPIPDASTETTYVPAASLFPNGIAEKSGSSATFAYEGDPTYGEHGYNLIYDTVEIPESVRIPEKPYAIPGYKFLGWARIADANSIPEGASASDYVTDPAQITPDDVYIRWVEDNATTGAGHYEAKGRPETQGDENWVTVTYVAANEQKPYHDMYAVWVGEFYVYHSGMEGGAVEKVTIDFKGGYDLTARVTALSQSRDGEADKFLYGGYYLDGGFTAPAVDDKGVPTATCAAYDGANWTWTTPVTDQPGNAITPKGGVTYYIKEVPASSYLQSYFHYTYKKEPLPENQTLSSAWVISAIDDAMYKETGFVIISDNDKANVCTQLTVETAVGGTKVVLKPETIFRSKGVQAGDFLSYLEVMTNGTKNLGFAENATVLQYWVTPDNMIVTGIASRTYGSLANKTAAKSGLTDATVHSTIGVFGG